MRVSAILGAHPSHPPHPTHSDHPGWANEEIIRFWQRPASLSGQILIGNWELSRWPCFQFSISQSRVLLPPAWSDIVIAVSPDSDVNYLSIWTQVRRRRRGPRPQVTQPPVLVWSALVIITHITITAPCFPDITRVSPARRQDTEEAKYCNKFEYYYQHRNHEKIAPPEIWGAGIRVCVSAVGGPGPLIWADTDLSLLSLDNKVDGKVLAVGILPLNSSIKLTFGSKNSFTFDVG